LTGPQRQAEHGLRLRPIIPPVAMILVGSFAPLMYLLTRKSSPKIL